MSSYSIDKLAGKIKKTKIAPNLDIYSLLYKIRRIVIFLTGNVRTIKFHTEIAFSRRMYLIWNLCIVSTEEIHLEKHSGIENQDLPCFQNSQIKQYNTD